MSDKTAKTKKAKKSKKAKKAKQAKKAKVVEKPVEETIEEKEEEGLLEEDLIKIEEKKKDEPSIEELISKKAEVEPEEEILEERLYTVPLGRTRDYPMYKRSKKAITLLKAFLMRHMKPEVMEFLRIDPELNDHIWQRGIRNPPRKVKIKVTKNEEGLVTAYLRE